NRRIAGAAVPVLLKGLGYALALSAIAAAGLCMFAYAPGALSYEIVAHGEGLVPGWAVSPSHVITRTPGLGSGGFLTIAGVLLGGFVVWGARTPARAPRPEPKRRRRARRTGAERPPTSPGPETDPFRAPPQPQPLAVVRHERPATT